jgi:hypothetical protein
MRVDDLQIICQHKKQILANSFILSLYKHLAKIYQSRHNAPSAQNGICPRPRLPAWQASSARYKASG